MSTSVTPVRTSRWRLVLVALGLSAVVWGFAFDQPARAETVIVSSSPADGEKLLTAPTQITAVFSEAIPTNSVMLAVCEGAPAPIGTATVGADGISLVAPVTGVLPVGECKVSYSVPQADGKVVTGGFAFEILDPATADPGDASVDASDGGNLAVDPPPVSGPLGLARVLAYIFLAALFGGAALIAFNWAEGVTDPHALKFLRLAWLGALLSNYVVAMLRASLASGKSVTGVLIPVGWGDLFDNLSGISTVLRVVLVGVSFMIVSRPERLIDPQSKLIALLVPGAAMASFALSRSTDELLPLNVVAGVVHTITIGLWVGGLLMLAQAVLAAPGEQDLVHAVREFSRSASAYIGVAVISGIISLYQLDGGAILTSRHGRLVVVKVIGVALMVYVGGAGRQFIKRALARRTNLNQKITAQLKRAVVAEIGIGAIVLIVTSWAAATLPQNIEPPGTDKTKYAFVGDRSGGEFDVQVKITPATVGLNAVRIDVYSPQTGLTDLKVQFNPPTPDTASVTLSVPLDGAGAARLPMKEEGVPFGAPGLWTVVVTGNGPNGVLPSVTYTVSVMANSSESTTTVPGDASGTTLVPGETTTTVGGAANVSTMAPGSPATVIVPLGGTTLAPAAQTVQPVTNAVTTTTTP